MNNRRKIVVIGASNVGSAVANKIADFQLATEVALIDLNEDKAWGEAKDSSHATSCIYSTNIKFHLGDYDDCKDANIIVITAGPSIRPGETPDRLKLAGTNAKIMQSVFEGTDTPIIFSAVTDPEGAGLVASNDAPGANITGTSDALNTDAIMNLIFAQNPDADKIGLLYSKSEDSSTKAIADAKAFLDDKGIAFTERTGTSTDEINQAVDALIADGVDAVFTPTDNTIMNAELAIYEKFIDAGIPHYTGADSFALNGAFLGFGINYADLGTKTGDIVADILGGADPASYPVVTLDSGIATINTDTASALGIDLDTVETAFQPYCSDIQEITTGESFTD